VGNVSSVALNLWGMTMSLNQLLICRHCGYDANPDAATHCEICNLSLHSSPRQTTQISSVFRLGSIVALLLALAGGGYVLWRNYSAPSQSTVSRPTPPVSSLPLTSGLGLYDSLKEVKNVPAGLFQYAGALTFAALSNQGMNRAIALSHPEFRLSYTEPINSSPGTTTGIAMLIDKQLAFAQAARPLKDEELSRATSRGFKLEQVPVLLDGLAVYVHPSLSLKGLSIEQLQGIFQGRITNWRQVGGPNLKIVPVSVDPKTTSLFQILFEGKDDAKLAANTRILRDLSACIRAVSTNRGAISYVSAAIVANQRRVRPLAIARGSSTTYVAPFLDSKSLENERASTRQINAPVFRDGSYPLTRRLFVIIRRDQSIDEQAGIAYANFLLSKEGQQIIQKAGFVPLRQVD
jgi:ABC-type phosphate transport system substrate-binding protein